MLDLLKLRIKHGYQAVPDILKAKVHASHLGFPIIHESQNESGCKACVDVCPTHAVSKNPLSIDLGKCIFCGECQRICKNDSIRFSSNHKLGNTNRDNLVITSRMDYNRYIDEAIESKKEIHKLFGRSLKLRQVSAAGCNGCEIELNACGNVNFDMGRFGIDFVASPRHADGIVFTRPISKNMSPALMDAYKSIADPKIVIAVGACAISGGIFAASDEIDRNFINEITVDLYVPGCPPHPLNFINALLGFINRR